MHLCRCVYDDVDTRWILIFGTATCKESTDAFTLRLVREQFVQSCMRQYGAEVFAKASCLQRRDARTVGWLHFLPTRHTLILAPALTNDAVFDLIALPWLSGYWLSIGRGFAVCVQLIRGGEPWQQAGGLLYYTWWPRRQSRLNSVDGGCMDCLCAPSWCYTVPALIFSRLPQSN